MKVKDSEPVILLLKMLSSSTGQHRDEFLAQTKAAREERQLAVVRAAAATRIQALVRGWLARLETRRRVIRQFDAAFPPLDTDKAGVSILF